MGGDTPHAVHCEATSRVELAVVPSIIGGSGCLRLVAPDTSAYLFMPTLLSWGPSVKWGFRRRSPT